MMAESREQRAESREQRAESREQRAKNCNGNRFECQPYICYTDCQLHNGTGKQRGLQPTRHGERCCYGNYKRVFKIDVEIAMAVLARDYKGFGSGLIPSNMVMEIYD